MLNGTAAFGALVQRASNRSPPMLPPGSARHSHSIISRPHNGLKLLVKKIFMVRYTVSQSVKNSRS